MASSRYNKSYKQNHGKAGVVYILDNPGLREGFYKIGCSRHSGARRADDLNRSANTGTPGSFRCFFQYQTKDCGKAEELVFWKLSKHRQGKWGQEFFHVELEIAKSVIIEVCREVDVLANVVFPVQKPDPVHRKDTFTISNASNIGNAKNELTLPRNTKSQSIADHPVANAIFLIVLAFILLNWILPYFNHITPSIISGPTASYVEHSADVRPAIKSKPKTKKTPLPVDDLSANAPQDKPRHEFVGENEVNSQIYSSTPDDSSQENIDSKSEPKPSMTKAELDNLKTCMEGRYKSLCKHDMLNQEQASKVSEAERAANLKTCLDGKNPSLCDHRLLTDVEVDTVDQAEKRANFKTCIDGKYPSLCKHDLLTESEANSVKSAELKENLKICIDGRYPSLCKHDLLTADEAEKVKISEGSR